MIPKGTYALGQVSIEGPCKAPISFVVQGTVKAPVDTSNFKAEAGWIAFERIDQFTLSGGGVFDGQGKSVWGKQCSISEYCKQLPIVSYKLLMSSLFYKINLSCLQIADKRY